jgi:UDP-N-acetylglucosamine 2-epimerase (non-hydrolysing)
MKSVFSDYRPELVLVHGDTSTSTMAALAAFYSQIKIGHVEAGLRTGNKYSPWPEEMNRKLTANLADYHFAPTSRAQDNLLAEGIAKKSVFVTGNTVIDSLKYIVDKINTTDLLDKLQKKFSFLDREKRLVLVTAHRRENFGEPFKEMCLAMRDIIEQHKNAELLYPVHLNPNVQTITQEILGDAKDRIHLIEPVDYVSFCYLLQSCHIVLTDSGGIQEEAPSLGKPVLVMRENTERPEAVESGTALLVGTERPRILREASKLLGDDEIYREMSCKKNPYGDGTAAASIRRIISESI